MRPAMSIVLVTDRQSTIRPVLDRLARQTIRERLELVVVARDPGSIEEPTPASGAFESVRVISVPPRAGLSAARAAGIRAATAPRVFVGETHSYAHPGMAAALLDAHDAGADVAVPAFGNANPDGVMSWAGFVADYGPWTDGAEAGPIGYAPFYNVSYERDVLLELGEELDRALDHGDGMLRFLRSTGRRIVFVPEARIDHLNLARTGAVLSEKFLAGMLIADARSRRWGRPRRLLYGLASPLIAVRLAGRVVRSARRIRRRDRPPRGILPAVIVLSAVKAAGEAVGYVRGAGGHAARRMEEYELHKLRLVRGR